MKTAQASKITTSIRVGRANGAVSEFVPIGISSMPTIHDLIPSPDVDSIELIYSSTELHTDRRLSIAPELVNVYFVEDGQSEVEVREILADSGRRPLRSYELVAMVRAGKIPALGVEQLWADTPFDVLVKGTNEQANRKARVYLSQGSNKLGVVVYEDDEAAAVSIPRIIATYPLSREECEMIGVTPFKVSNIEEIDKAA